MPLLCGLWTGGKLSGGPPCPAARSDGKRGGARSGAQNIHADDTTPARGQGEALGQQGQSS